MTSPPNTTGWNSARSNFTKFAQVKYIKTMTNNRNYVIKKHGFVQWLPASAP